MKLVSFLQIILSKKLYFLLASLLIFKIGNTQSIDTTKLRFCIGKINAIRELLTVEEITNPVITNKVLEEGEFNAVWQGLVNDTKRFSQIVFGKKYEILLQYDESGLRRSNAGEYSDPLGWSFVFISHSKIKVEYWYHEGRVSDVSLHAIYELSNNQYDLKIINTTTGIHPRGYGHISSSQNFIIKNDKIIRRFTSSE